MKGGKDRERTLSAVPKGRGDFPIWLGLGMWLFATLGYVALSHYLVPEFPLWIIFVFGLVWTPLISYVNARMIGLTGQGVGFPFLKESVYILSGYERADIWFAPIPVGDLGGTAQRFREMELARTRFTSIFKAEVLMLPTILIASFVFWQFFWHTSQIPSAQYPFANRFWPMIATMQSIWLTANKAGASNFLLQALKPEVMVGSGVGALALFAYPESSDGSRSEHVRAHLAGRLHLAGGLNQRLALMPFDLGHPIWVNADEIDLGQHVRHARLPKPGSLAALEKLVAAPQ